MRIRELITKACGSSEPASLLGEWQRHPETAKLSGVPIDVFRLVLFVFSVLSCPFGSLMSAVLRWVPQIHKPLDSKCWESKQQFKWREKGRQIILKLGNQKKNLSPLFKREFKRSSSPVVSAYFCFCQSWATVSLQNVSWQLGVLFIRQPEHTSRRLFLIVGAIAYCKLHQIICKPIK